MRPEHRDMLDAASALLRRYWRESRVMITLLALFSFVSSVAYVGAPYIFSQLIDRLGAAAGPAALGFLAYAVLLGVSSTLEEIAAYIAFVCAKRLDFVIQTSFFDKLMKKTAPFFVDHNPVEIESARETGSEALKEVFELALVNLMPGATQIVLSLVVLGAKISWFITPIVVVYGAVFIALLYFANMKTRPELEAAIAATLENAKFAGGAISAMETLRLFGSERWMRGKFAAKAGETRDNWLKYCFKRIPYSAGYGAAMILEFAITFAILLPMFRSGRLSVGDLVLFNVVILRLNHPFEMIGHAITEVTRAYHEFRPFARLWSAPEAVEPDGSRTFAPTAGHIAFEDVAFFYEPGRGVERVSFAAERGAITYLIGETGSGKSTILKLALKILEPAAGRIWVDGMDLREITRAGWHAAIGVVPQDVMLIGDTLRANIVLGRPPDETRLRYAADKAAILDFVESLPEGFDTPVGERGLALSGGERQRVAIARALYGDPKILFLDEPSSALDERTEAGILAHLRLIADRVTIVAITHREALIAPGDRVVRVRGGATATETDLST